MRGLLPFVIIIKETEFILKLEGDTPTVLCNLFENPVTFHEDNQGVIALAICLQMRPRTKHIAIK